jgi:hypothetical protein
VMKTDINEEKKYFKSFVEDVKQINWGWYRSNKNC